VHLDHVAAGLDRASVVTTDGLHTVAQSILTTCVGELDDAVLEQVCSAVISALGC
jgi:mRNA-degrading endonuclease toxin of MazEF toxin-antitoxin module